VAAFVDAPILPTPLAVLRAAELLAEGTLPIADCRLPIADCPDLDNPKSEIRNPKWEGGLGHLLVVDVGGATTDVHSVAEEPPLPPGWIRRGLPEPHVKRTVEGDLGLRVSAETLLQEAGNWETGKLGNWETGKLGNWETGPSCRVAKFPNCLISQFPDFLCRYAAQVSRQVDHVPNTEAEAEADALLARAAVELAVRRHVGTVEELSTPAGRVFRQHGKDLSEVTAVVGTGGVFAHTSHARWLLAPVLREPGDPSLLQPTAARFWVDRSYCLWAGGLLREVAPAAALRLMRGSLEEI
jgi:hypothetical protein